MNHREIIELLPWYANQTLDEDERKAVETHLSECAECANEVKNLNTMKKAIIESGNQGPVLSPFAPNRALAQVEDYERAKSPAAASSPEPEKSFWSRWWSPTPIFARALIAAQVVLLLALGSLTLYQHSHPAVVYTTSSGGAGENKTSFRIAVQFSDSANEQDIRKTILGIRGKIVDGPSALGLYTVEVPITGERRAEMDRVLETLRQNQHIVRFAAEKQ